MSPGVNGSSHNPRCALHHAALIAGVTTALSLPIPMWNYVRAMIALHTRYPKRLWWQEPGALISGAITLTMSIFYFCLSTNRGRLVVSERLKALSLAGVLALGVITAIGISASLRALFAERHVSLFAPGDAPVLGGLGDVLGQVSNIAAILVLIALYRSHVDDSERCEPGAKLLRTVAMITAIGWGLAVSFGIIRLFILDPLIYVQYHNDPRLAGLATVASLANGIGGDVRFLVAQFGFFVGPYVIWRGYK